MNSASGSGIMKSRSAITDFVMRLGHGEVEPTESEEIQFRQQLNRKGEKIFSIIDNNRSTDTKYVGQEEDAGVGFEYVLALIDSETREIEFRPTSLIRFEAKFLPNAQQQEKVDFKKDFNEESEEYMVKRRRLTMDFGSISSNKKLNASARRSINDQTLEAMASTAFISHDGLKTEAEEKSDLSSISLLKTNDASSSVLPSKNSMARSPGEIYSFEQFLPATGITGTATNVQKHFKLLKSIENITKQGIGETVAQRILDTRKITFLEPASRAYIAMKVFVMSSICPLIFTSKEGHPFVRSISMSQLENLKPDDVVQDVLLEYFGQISKNKHGSQIIRFTSIEKHKFVAHLFCLLLLIDSPDFQLPISPMVSELGVPENIVSKLLQGLGCIITTATPEQALSFNSMKMGRLIVAAGKNWSRRKTFG